MVRVTVFALLVLISGCSMKKEKVDLLVKDARVYTVDEAFRIVDAFVVTDGKIVDTGSVEAMERSYEATDTLSLKGKYIYPGWNDAHCHFLGYGLTLNQADLVGTSSPEEVLERCRQFRDTAHPDWITGRGWDQNDWDEKVFPGLEMIDGVFPDIPVYIKRIDGHAAWVNSVAMELAGITPETCIEGGEVLLENGALKGILIDNAMELVEKVIPEPGPEEQEHALKLAEANCFRVGLTSVSDAGLDAGEVALIDSLQESGNLKMRINAMLSPTKENYDRYVSKGPLVNERLSIRTIKLYADGALGSRGAKLIADYSDDPGNNGLLLTPPDELREHCQKAYDNDFQVAVHCIGDGANRQMLQIYGDMLGTENDRRWRIEHAQIVHPDDLGLFGKYHIVPSVQPTHATSDMYWADERLGKKRLGRGAYAYRSLMEQNGWIPNGSDFPVEDINPLYGFYAAVSRKDQKGYPEGGFIPDEALTREQALRAMTSWAARAAFEESFKGSIEPGKLADFVVTGQDIMTIPEGDIPTVRVLMTYSGGSLVYRTEKNQ
jgi:predicted amidohydrolase YtcJ